MVLSTTSRSRAAGARMSSVTRRFEFQNCRSPSRSLRISLKDRFSAGVSGRTTTATSPPAPAARMGNSARASPAMQVKRRSRVCMRPMSCVRIIAGTGWRDAVARAALFWLRCGASVERPNQILVVDDEPDLELLVRQRFRRQIRDRELEFFFSRNGEEALAALARQPGIDLVLSDINMPVDRKS